MVEAMFKKELEYYEKHKRKLIQNHEGQFALIEGESLLGSFTTEAEAYEYGLKQVGNKPFFIKRVSKEEDIERVPALILGLINADS